MKNKRIKFLKKISQDISSLKENSSTLGDSEKINIINQILTELTSPIDYLSKDVVFKPSDKTLNAITNLAKDTTEEEIKAIRDLAAKFDAKSPSQGREMTNELAGELTKASSLGLNDEFLKTATEGLFEALFKAELKNKIDENILNVISSDLRNHGAFCLYEKRGISKIASKLQPQEICFDKNLEIFNKRLEVYSNKTAGLWDFVKSTASGIASAVSGVGQAAGKAVSTLVEYGGKALSGAWKFVKGLGSKVFKLLPFVAIIWDIWDLAVNCIKVWKIWNTELGKYSSYGSERELINLSFLQNLYPKLKADTSASGLQKILDFVKIVKLSQAFDECFITGLTNFFLVIEDIIALFIDWIPGIGWIIDIAVSVGIAMYGHSVVEKRREGFNQLKDLIYQEMDELKSKEMEEKGITEDKPPVAINQPEEPKGFFGTATNILASGVNSLMQPANPSLSAD